MKDKKIKILIISFIKFLILYLYLYLHLYSLYLAAFFLIYPLYYIVVLDNRNKTKYIYCQKYNLEI